MRPLLSMIVVLVTMNAHGAEPKPSDTETLFALRVYPVLKAKCFACHGDDADKIKGRLDLTTRTALLKGGDSKTPAIIIGKAKESLLYRAIIRHDAEVSPMPPKENDKLTEAEILAFAEWINRDAPWPAADRIAAIVNAQHPAGVAVKTSGGLSPDWTNRRYQPADLWAYQPLRPSRIVADINIVDAMIDADLAKRPLQPAPTADRRTLIRRVTYDLTGLPPTPGEIEQFVTDPANDDHAFAKVVDRLLASPHYGEKMARHWLDVVRYADSAGFANDYDRGNAWRYRDYVVRSFNTDKPYDRFVREQIAGDELNPDDPEMLIAVGFLRMGAWELTGMEVAKVARQRLLDDVTDSVGQVFLGHMLQCARCHDHKFDPVPTRDYYRIQATFATMQVVERPAAFLTNENITGFEEKKYLDARRIALEKELKRIQLAETTGRAKWEAEHPNEKGMKPPRHEFLLAADLGLERIARKGLERLKWEYERYEPIALSVYSGPTPDVKSIYAPVRLPKVMSKGPAETTHILAGGDPFSPKDEVTSGVLSALGEQPIPNTIHGRRHAFAEWLTKPNNPLFARVMANRVWQWTMGMPIVGNPNNFGATGKKPTHPELLDALAAQFIAERWSVKQLQRTILLSRAYRRSSQHPDPKSLVANDANGASYAVFKPRRLTAEELRDSLLAVSGELNRTVGGIPVRPEINADIAFQPRQVMGTFAPAWEPSPKPEQRHRRTIYTLQLRGLRDPMLEIFNAPTPELSCEARDVSLVAPQAFALFNAEATRQRALALAMKVLKESRTPDETIARLFSEVFGRRATRTEAKACLDHWQAMTERHRTITIPAPKYAKSITREAVEENTGVKFTYTEQLPAMVDFVPDAHPADARPDVRGLMEVCLVLFNTNEFIYVD